MSSGISFQFKGKAHGKGLSAEFVFGLGNVMQSHYILTFVHINMDIISQFQKNNNK